MALLAQIHRVRMQRIQMLTMRSQLLHRTGTERIASSDQHTMSVLIQPKCDLCQLGRFAHTVHATEHNNVRLTVLRVRLVHIA